MRSEQSASAAVNPKANSVALGFFACEEQAEPLVAFCALAQEAGVDLSVGELFAIGMEYSDNQCKSTNGGNPSPYEAFDDAYENFISSISY